MMWKDFIQSIDGRDRYPGLGLATLDCNRFYAFQIPGLAATPVGMGVVVIVRPLVGM